MIVLDASLAVAWLLNEPNNIDAREVYQALPTEAVVVPNHWSAEVANVPLSNIRRGRLSLAEFDTLTADLAALQLTIDGAPLVADMGLLTRFALTRNLTVYDAIYDQLAARLEAPLATLDRAMRAAASDLQLPVLPA